MGIVRYYQICLIFHDIPFSICLPLPSIILYLCIWQTVQNSLPGIDSIQSMSYEYLYLYNQAKIVKIEMLKNILSSLRHTISVYQGISPSLLATISLSSCLKSDIKSNEELVNVLVKNSIIFQKDLIHVMRSFDRKNFIRISKPHQPATQTNQNYYQNKPYKIQGGQCMTDIFTHAVMLDRITDFLNRKIESKSQQPISVLDIGTGHGYLAYVIAAFMDRMAQEHSYKGEFDITGIDAIQSCIKYCEDLGSVVNRHKSLIFKNISLQKYINSNANKKFDVIIGGFYIPPQLSTTLINQLKASESLGIWATDGVNGQQLKMFQKQNNNKVKEENIMATMFSEPIVESAVSKYFVEGLDEAEQQNNKDKDESNRNTEELLKLKREQLQKNKKQLRSRLKEQILVHQQNTNKSKLSLQEMRKVPRIKCVLDELQKLK